MKKHEQISSGRSRLPEKPSLIAAGLLVGLTLLPVSTHLHPRVVLVCYLLLAVRIFMFQRNRVEIPRFLKAILTLGGILVVLTHTNRLVGSDWGLALLSMMLVLKYFEARADRDLYLLVFFAFFHTVSQFIYRDSFFVISYHLVLSYGYFLLLLGVTTHSFRFRTAQLQKLGLVFAQALPIALVLFYLFPRLAVPLWSFSVDHKRASTGLAEQVTPGAIAELSLSNSVAFRAYFEADMPAKAKLYWRTLTFAKTNGETWFLESPEESSDPPMGEAPTGAIDYQITLEPTGTRWLPALSLPMDGENPTRVVNNHTLVHTKNVDERMRYSVTSATDVRYGLDLPDGRYLDLPDMVTPRISALLADWRGRAGADDGAVVRMALDFFRRENFVYSLRPPLLGDNPTDEFLFESRKGFCEHYATSFTLLMRAAGIPSRLVTGYQGGELNEFGNYLIIRQSDAHAWSEVWLPESGWMRVDPTAAVAPERVEQGISVIDEGLGAAVQFRGSDLSWLRQTHYRISWMLDSLNQGWANWVLGFDRDKQIGLNRWLGLQSWSGYGWLLITLIIAVGIGLVSRWWLRVYRKRLQDPLLRTYLAFAAKASKAGCPPRTGEGPRDYFTRVARRFPANQAIVDGIAASYLRQRYGGKSNATMRQQLRTLVRRLRLS